MPAAVALHAAGCGVAWPSCGQCVAATSAGISCNLQGSLGPAFAKYSSENVDKFGGAQPPTAHVLGVVNKDSPSPPTPAVGLDANPRLKGNSSTKPARRPNNLGKASTRARGGGGGKPS